MQLFADRALDAANLLAFLLDRMVGTVSANLSAHQLTSIRLIKGPFPEISWLR